MAISEYHFNNDHISQDNLFIKLAKGGLSVTTGAVSKKIHKKIKFNTPTATINI
jgi:hypothetical protein